MHGLHSGSMILVTQNRRVRFPAGTDVVSSNPISSTEFLFILDAGNSYYTVHILSSTQFLLTYRIHAYIAPRTRGAPGTNHGHASLRRLVREYTAVSAS